jgi:hypothetical protein
MFAFELAVHPGPVRLRKLPMPLLLPGITIHPAFQNRVRDLIVQRPGQTRSGEPL